MDPNPNPQGSETVLARALTLGGFSEQEKVKILSYLGYPRWYSLAPAIAFGYPSATEPLYITEDAFRRISPDGRNKVREDICALDALECALRQDALRGSVESTGDVRFNLRAGRAKLLGERKRLVQILADDLGCFPNPYSQTYGVGPNRVINT
jgi:hypothetical protein